MRWRKLFPFSSRNLILRQYKIFLVSLPIARHPYLRSLYFCLFIQSNFPLGTIVIAPRCFSTIESHVRPISRRGVTKQKTKSTAGFTQCIVIITSLWFHCERGDKSLEGFVTRQPKCLLRINWRWKVRELTRTIA